MCVCVFNWTLTICCELDYQLIDAVDYIQFLFEWMILEEQRQEYY